MIISCLSVSGSPGVSTTALMLTLQAPQNRRALLIEADPVGSSPTLMGYLQGQVRHDRGVVNLVDPFMKGSLETAFDQQLVPMADQGRASVLPGIRNARQNTTTIPTFWSAIADHVGGLSADGANIVIDAGRIAPNQVLHPLVQRSDLVLLFQRPTMASVAATRSMFPVLRSSLEQSRSRAPVGLAVVGSRPYGAAEVSRNLKLPVALTIPYDRRGIRFYSEGVRLSGFTRSRSALLRHVPKLWTSAASFAEHHQPEWLRAETH